MSDHWQNYTGQILTAESVKAVGVALAALRKSRKPTVALALRARNGQTVRAVLTDAGVLKQP